MPPQTAILAWGSFLWEGGAEFERWHDDWRFDGPSLKLEFSRVSSSRLGALTLVVDPQGAPTVVAWCLSKRKDPADAVADVRCREGCAIRHIARLNLPASPEAWLSMRVRWRSVRGRKRAMSVTGHLYKERLPCLKSKPITSP